MNCPLYYFEANSPYSCKIDGVLYFLYALLEDINVEHIAGARSKFWGASGLEDRGGGDNSIQFINIGRVGDRSFKELRRKIGGGRVGDNNILTFLCYWLDKKCHFEKTAFCAIFSIRICKVS